CKTWNSPDMNPRCTVSAYTGKADKECVAFLSCAPASSLASFCAWGELLVCTTMQTHRDNPARNQRSRASWVTDLHPYHKEILENMKKLLTLLFAAALTLSLSSAAFAQDTS